MVLKRNRKTLLLGLREVGTEMGPEGKALTGLIGELSACDVFEPLNWEPRGGFDARAGRTRFQIKTRRPESGDVLKVSGDVKRHKNYSFDQGLFVELDSKFEVVRIWQMSVFKIRRIEKTILNEGRGIGIATYRREAHLVYSRDMNESQGVRQLVFKR